MKAVDLAKWVLLYFASAAVAYLAEPGWPERMWIFGIIILWPTILLVRSVRKR